MLANQISRNCYFVLVLLLLLLPLLSLEASAQPFPFTQTDLGTVGTPGTFSYSSGTYTIGGSGVGPGGTSDNMCVVTTSLSDNVEITARLTSQTNTDNNAFAGVLIRQSTSGEAPSAFIGVQPGSGLKFIYRTTSGGSSTTVSGPAATLPVYVRINKNGSRLRGYYSSDAINWTSLGSPSISLTNSFLGGFAVSSNVMGLSTAVFDELHLLTSMPTVGGTELKQWFRADAGLTTSSGKIANWDPAVGHALSQGSDSIRPTVSTNAINGLPAVSFDGTQNFSHAPANNFPNPRGTVIAVVKAETQSGDGWRWILDSSDFGSERSLSLRVDDQINRHCSVVTDNVPNELQIEGIDSSFQIIQAQQDQQLPTDIGTFSRNGVVLNNGQLTRLDEGTFFNIGSDVLTEGKFKGKIAEVMVWSSILTSSEQAEISAYLNNKYGMQDLPLPTVSPAGGVYDPASAPVSVSISTPSGGTTFYTIDGSDPRSSATRIQYSTPFSVSAQTTVQAATQYGSYYSPIQFAYFQFDANANNVARSGLVTWLKADCGTDTTVGNQLARWTDMSNTNTARGGNGLILQQNVLNNLPVATFSTSSDQWQTFGPGFQTFNGLSLYAVVKGELSGSILKLGDGNSANAISLAASGTYLTFNKGSGGIGAMPILSSTEYKLIEIIHDGTNLGTTTVYSNSAQVAQATLGSIPNILRNQNLLGYAQGTSGNGLAELLLYNRPLTAQERLLLQYYISVKYGINSNPEALQPTISPGTRVLPYSKTVVVTLSTTETGATIRWTSDGTDPTSSSPIYDPNKKPEVLAPAIVKARAFKQYYRDSEVASVEFKVDSSTAQVPEDKLVWLRADTGVDTGANQTVTTWRDLSGNDLHATATTSPPTLSAGAVDFNGTANFLSLPSGFANFSAGCTLFVVAKPEGTVSTDERIIDFGSGSTTNSFFLSRNTASNAKFAVFNNTTSSSVLGAYTNNQLQIFEATQDGAGTGKIFVNAVQKGSGAVSNIPNVTRTTNSIGRFGNNTLFFDGQIKEIIMYNRVLSDGERKEVEAYLAARNSLPGPTIDPPTLNVADAVVSADPVVVEINGQSRFTKKWTADTSATPTWYDYTGPITVSSSTVIRAKLTAPNWQDSPEVSTFISIDPNTRNVPRTNLRFWHTADNGVEPIGAVQSTTITKWRDSSGNGRTATKVGNGPTYDLSNGIKEIKFAAGSSQYLSLPADAAPSGDKTMFVVFRPGTLAINKRILDFGTGSATTNSFYISESSATPVKANYTVFNSVANTATINRTLTTGTVYLAEVSHGGGSADLYLNEAATPPGQTTLLGAAVQAPNAVSRTVNSIGRSGAGTPYYDGRIMEILVYDGVLSSQNRQAVEQYLSSKYSLYPQAQIDVTSISPASSLVSTTPQVAVTAPAGADVHYTVDGTPPSASSPSSPLAPATVTPNLSGIPETFKFQAASISPTTGLPGKILSQTYQFEYGSWLPVLNYTTTQGFLKLWLKPEFGITADANLKVSKWVSAVPDGASQREATQSNYGKQPRLIKNAINGHDAIFFDASAQQNFSLSDLTSPPQPHIFAVIKPIGQQAGHLLSAATDTSGTNPIIFDRGANGTDLRFCVWKDPTTGFTYVTAPSALTLDRYQLVEAYTAPDVLGARIFLAVNANELVNGTSSRNPNAFSRPNTHIGSAYNGTSGFFNGMLAELLVYGDTTPESILKGVRAYLINKYQLQSVKPDPPVFSTTSLSAPGQVVLSAPSDVEIRFTTDGTTATQNSNLYSKPIDVYFSQTINATAFKNGVASDPATPVTYTLNSNLYPAPDPADLSPLNINLQLPTNATP